VTDDDGFRLVTCRHGRRQLQLRLRRRRARGLALAAEPGLQRQHPIGRRRPRSARPAATDGDVGGEVRRRAGVGLGAHGHERPEHRADGAEAPGPARPPAGAAHQHLAERPAELLRGAPALEERTMAVAWLALYAAQRHCN